MKKSSLEIMHQKSDTGTTLSSWRCHSSMIGPRRIQSQGQKGAESVHGGCQQEQRTWGTATGEKGAGPERDLRLEHPALTTGGQMPFLVESTKVTAWKRRVGMAGTRS